MSISLKPYLASFIACFFVLNGFAQKQNIYFLKNDGRYVDVKDSADFVRIVREPDPGTTLYNVLEYYLNGNTKLVGKSSEVEPVKLEGTVISYYPNKKKKCVANYQKGKLSGVFYDYFPNGKMYRAIEFKSDRHGSSPNPFLVADEVVHLVNDSTGKATVTDGNGHYQVYDNDFQLIKEEGDIKNGKRNGTWKGFSNPGDGLFKEEYADGKFVKGTSYTEKGSGMYFTNYVVKEALPTYEGGDEGFGRYLAQTMRYPKIARDQNLQGKVIAAFVIDKTGNLSTIRILKTLSKETDAEVTRTFKAAKKWKPGI